MIVARRPWPTPPLRDMTKWRCFCCRAARIPTGKTTGEGPPGSGLPVRGTRSAALIQVFFAGQLSDEEILEMFERIAALMRAGLETLESLPQNIEAYRESVQSPREFYCWMLTLDYGINSARANVAWVEDVIERIRGGEVPVA